MIRTILKRSTGCSILIAALIALPMLAHGRQTTVLSITGEPQYAWNGKHFAHADPNAPKGGTLHLAANGNFDSMHPYIARGIPAAGIGLTSDTLGVAAPDHATLEYYGLIARSFEVAEDKSSVTFYLRPEARFHDGTPITAEDVAFTFELLTQQGAPSWRQYYAAVQGAEVLSPHSVRFTFKERNNAELPVILAQLPVLPKHYWQNRDFSKPTLTPPLGSGPYKVKDYAMGSSIAYERVPDYWARDLPVNKGRYNFDTIRYEYYRDQTVAREAFKAGEFDLYPERTAKAWAKAYTGAAVERGHIVRETLPTNKPQGMYGFFFNTRRPLFADRRVRQAVSLAFDFEWTNRSLFHDAYKRSYSWFSNSAFAATGLPSAQERAILEPYRNTLPKELFETAYAPPATDGSGSIRPVLRPALALLGDAGWHLHKGKLVDGRGKPFEFTVLIQSKSLDRVLLPFRKNLARLGITMHISLADQTQYINRLRAFDYDMILTRTPQSSSPGNELRNYWSSKAASTQGSRNYAGIRSEVADALIERIIASPDRKQLVTNCRALDRMLLRQNYVIPGWYSPAMRVAYWDKFDRAPVAPPTGLDIHSWWVNPAKETALEHAATGYGK